MNDAVWIDGSWRRGSGDVFQNYCPATGDVAWEGASATAGDVHDAVESARRAFHGWSIMPQSERTAILEAYADEIGKRTDAIAEALPLLIEGDDPGFMTRVAYLAPPPSAAKDSDDEGKN